MTIHDALEATLLLCGIDRPTAGIMEPDFEMRQMRAIMDHAGKSIARRAEWSGVQRTTTLLAGSAQYNLPADFQEMAEAGAVLVGDEFARPIVDPTLWEMVVREPSTQPFYHVKGGDIFFSPAPANNVTLRYSSRAWIVGGKERITGDDDRPVFPSDLLAKATVWRWNRQKGLDYADELAEFEAALEAAIKADRLAA